MARQPETAAAEADRHPDPVDPQPDGGADDVTPDDLAVDGVALAQAMGAPPAATAIATSETATVIARDGLKLRSGPGLEFPSIRSLPFATRVYILKREGNWALVDQAGDGAADGHVLLSYLRPDGIAVPQPLLRALPNESSFVPLNRTILQTIMDRCGGTRVTSPLDLDVVSDALNRSMLLADAKTRLREVAFLSQSVIETAYFKTFAEYGHGRGKAYSPFYGRGMHQLTWQATYAACSRAVFGDDRLVKDPDLIVKDIEVNVKATAWYWRDYKPFNHLADNGDIDEIIHRLYGGKITSPNPKVRQSVTLRRGYYTTIKSILSQVA